jgi:hypothetical protein
VSTVLIVTALLVLIVPALSVLIVTSLLAVIVISLLVLFAEMRHLNDSLIDPVDSKDHH